MTKLVFEATEDIAEDIADFIDAIKHFNKDSGSRNDIICKFIWYVYGQEALNGDDIEEIMSALKEWNGDE